MSTSSRFLSRTQLRGLRKLGDGMCPGDDELPSFSACGCAEHIDDVLAEMGEGDLDQLRLLLRTTAFMPRPAVAGLLRLAESSPHMRDGNPLAPTLRFLRLGLRGLVLSLYYSGRVGASYAGPSPLEVIGYDVGVYTGDLEG